MTRRLPNCALCGETLRRKGRGIIKLTAKPGRPMVVWYENCDWGTKDPEFLSLKPDGDAGACDASQVDSALEAIATRGPGRVAWSDGLARG